MIGAFLSLDTTRQRRVGSSPHPERHDPLFWLDELRISWGWVSNGSSRTCSSTTRATLQLCPDWQRWLRQHRPPVLVVWGRRNPSFALGGAMAYRKEVPDVEVHIFEAGYFALERWTRLPRR